MPVSRQQIVEVARSYCGVKYTHQGRKRNIGLDCGGLILMVARDLGLSELEELGYATSAPESDRFEQLLNENADNLHIESFPPHRFDGTEFLPGDILAYDYQKGEGISHTSFISKWDGRCYWVVDALNDIGVSEHAFRFPFSKARILGFRIRIDEI